MPGYIFQRPDGWLNIYYLHIYKFYVQHVEIRPILDHIHLIASDVSVGICGSWDVNRTSFLLVRASGAVRPLQLLSRDSMKDIIRKESA